MKKKELEQLREKSQPELIDEIAKKRDRLWSLQLDLRAGKVKNAREVRLLKRGIATIKTVLRERVTGNKK